ncbi:MAG: VWA domain-containing protein [Phycisphaerales bacterium]|nr:VWA domain-containing protein [Phycisphaerales bacterium]
MELQFNNLDNLFWLWAILAAGITLLMAAKMRNRALQRFAGNKLAQELTISSSPGRRRLRPWLIMATLILIVAAMLDPRWGVRYQELQRRGIDVFFVLDTSRSMTAQDVKPDRFDRSKQYIEDILESLGGDRVGLVTVAGDPSITVPLTLDYSALRLALDETGISTGRRGGSLIGDGIREATEAFTDDLEDHKAIIVLSDGDDMDSYPIEAAAQAEAKGIRVYTVGIGNAAEGARIPVTNGGQSGWLTHEGEQVWSQLKPELLQDIAAAGGGLYVPAGTSNADLAEIYEQTIAPGAGRNQGTATVERHIPRYRWLVLPAILLLLLDSFMGQRRRRLARQQAMNPQLRLAAQGAVA